MTLNRNSELPDISRRGFPVYMQNPTIAGVPLHQKERAYRVAKGNQMMLVDEATGEIAGHGVAAFLQREFVDPERFVKVYLGALDDMFSLTKTGQRVFKMLWEQVQANPDTDRVELTPLVAKYRGLKVSPRLFHARRDCEDSDRLGAAIRRNRRRPSRQAPRTATSRNAV